jgi:EF hand domain-containing protein
MKKSVNCLLSFLTAFWGFFAVLSVSSIDLAFAKPPPWAPAHGYRRKHGDDDDQGEDRDHDRWRREERTDVIHEVIVSRYEEIFRRIDINRDGLISRSEFSEGDSLFDRLDRNHDGVLTRGEYDRIDEERGLLSGLLHKLKDKVASLWDKLF